MFNYKTLSLYLFLEYLKYFFVTTAIVMGFLTLASIFNVMQSYKEYATSLNIFSQLVILRIPSLFNEIVPLLSFVSMLLFLKNLTKHNELIIISYNGISVTKMLMIPVIASLLLGVIFITIISPLSTYSLQRLDHLKIRVNQEKRNPTNTENNNTQADQSGVTVLKDSVLFFEEYNNENRIIKTKSVNFNTKEFNDTIVLILDADNNLIKRIDTELVILEQNNFKLINCKIFTDSDCTEEKEILLPTKLSIDNLAQHYLRPNMIYIWDLPTVMGNLVKSGFPITDYKIYYYKQIFKPLYMVAMVVLACCFLSFNNRNNYQTKILGLGLLVGIFAYSSLEIGVKMLVYSGIAPISAILLPIFLIITVGNFVILHLY